MGPPLPPRISSTICLRLIRKFSANRTSVMARGLKKVFSPTLWRYGALLGIGVQEQGVGQRRNRIGVELGLGVGRKRAVGGTRHQLPEGVGLALRGVLQADLLGHPDVDVDLVDDRTLLDRLGGYHRGGRHDQDKDGNDSLHPSALLSHVGGFLHSLSTIVGWPDASVCISGAGQTDSGAEWIRPTGWEGSGWGRFRLSRHPCRTGRTRLCREPRNRQPPGSWLPAKRSTGRRSRGRRSRRSRPGRGSTLRR